jgi:hypothetical protein
MLAQHQPDVEIHGTCAEQFGRVRAAFADLLTNGQDIGASVAVVIEGEPVIDLWGGYFDDTYTDRGQATRSRMAFRRRRR